MLLRFKNSIAPLALLKVENKSILNRLEKKTRKFLRYDTNLGRYSISGQRLL